MSNFIMHSASLYVITVLIWGSTFYAIKYQLGIVEIEVSLAYRFFLASSVLLFYCLITGKNLRYSASQHFYIFLQGLFLFSVNYVFAYLATGLLTSGVVAIIFSTVIVMNIINGALFMRIPIKKQSVIGALFGIAGITAIFWSEVSGLENSEDSWKGMFTCLVATLLASIGNILSARNQKNKLPVVQTNAWGMGYGALIMLVYAVYQDLPFSYDASAGYTISLLYLSIFGSVVAFGSYLTLIGRIGAEKTAYTAVLFPLIALSISTIFEDYHWSLAAIFGIGLVIIGNYLVLRKPLVLTEI